MSNKTNKYRRTTVTGRIVYPRDKHLFNFSDVYRVLKKVSLRAGSDYLGILLYFIREFFKYVVERIRNEQKNNFYLDEYIAGFYKRTILSLIYELFRIIQESLSTPSDIIKSIVWQIYQTFK
jgi:hypothetical protein